MKPTSIFKYIPTMQDKKWLKLWKKTLKKTKTKQETMKVLFFKLNVKNMQEKNTLLVCALKPLIYFGSTAFDLLELGIHLVGSFMVVVCGDLVELSALQTEKQKEKPVSETNARKCDCYLLWKGKKGHPLVFTCSLLSGCRYLSKRQHFSKAMPLNS